MSRPKLTAWVEAEVLSLGEDTLASLMADVLTRDGLVGRAFTDTTAIAAGDRLALTFVEASSYAEGSDGSGAGVTAGTEATAVGEDAQAVSRVKTLAISAKHVDIAFGFAGSRAHGEDLEDADAWVTLEGDITITRELGGNENPYLPNGTFAGAVGIGIDLPDWLDHWA